MDKEDVVGMYMCTQTRACTRAHTHTHTHTMEYYSVIKKNEILPFATTWMVLEGVIMLGEIRWRKTNTLCYHLHVESKK